ncbi:MAG: hypothetical protein IJW83_02700 [Clostridia bacterium]|nr:hypothetical protein [Clostridia bacterium]
MTAYTLCGVAVLLAVVAFSLREFGYRGAPLFGLLCAISLLSAGLAPLRELFPVLSKLSVTEEVAEAASAALRIVGVGYVSMIATDICRDLGEVGIARAVVLLSRLSILALAYPFIERILAVGYSLLQ